MLQAMPSREQKQYQTFATIVDSKSNYSAYRKTAQRDAERGCIPWHEVHLRDIIGDISVILKEDDIDNHHELPLINFKKWTRLKEKAFDALRYRDTPPEYNKEGLEMAMAYLEWHLQAVTVGDDYIHSVGTESARLTKDEAAWGRQRAIGLVFKSRR